MEGKERGGGDERGREGSQGRGEGISDREMGKEEEEEKHEEIGIRVGVKREGRKRCGKKRMKERHTPYTTIILFHD